MLNQNNEPQNLILKPLPSRRGRPKRMNDGNKRVSRRRKHYGNSTLAILYHQNKISTAQFNAAETFRWIIQQIKKNIPLPGLVQNKYQEKIKGTIWKEIPHQEDNFRDVYKFWRLSLFTLESAGTITKTLVENLIHGDGSFYHEISDVELHLIRRGLDYLIDIYP